MDVGPDFKNRVFLATVSTEAPAQNTGITK